MTTMIMLVEPQHLPVPDNVTVVQEFGEECVVTEDGNKVHHTRGISMVLEGDNEAIKAWLKPFAGFWVTNNPMVGDWRVVHIKD